MYQRPKRVGISNVGPKQRSKFQNNMGIRERKEGAKKVFSRVIKKGHLGLHTGRMAAQNPSSHQGTLAGQRPRRYTEQVEWPTVRNDADDQRAKSTGLSVEKTKVQRTIASSLFREAKTLWVKKRCIKRSFQLKRRGRKRTTTRNGA